MNVIVKWIISAGMALYVTQAVSADLVNIYRGPRGDALLIDSSGIRTFMIAGGAIPHGIATPADCFAQATLKLIKAPNYFEGDLSPVKNEIVDANEGRFQGKDLVYMCFRKKFTWETSRLMVCAQIPLIFRGVYRQIASGSNAYKWIFLYFMRLVNQDAMHLKERGNIDAAIRELKPFVEGCRKEWLIDRRDKNVIEEAVRDYEKLIGNKRYT